MTKKTASKLSIKFCVVPAILVLVLVVAVLYSQGFYVKYSSHSIVAKQPLSPLVEAIDNGVSVDVIKEMVDADPGLLLVPTPPFGTLPLKYAVVVNDCKMVNVFAGKDGVYTADYLASVLSYALKKKRYNCASYIAEAIPLDPESNYNAKVKEIYDEFGVAP